MITTDIGERDSAVWLKLVWRCTAATATLVLAASFVGACAASSGAPATPTPAARGVAPPGSPEASVIAPASATNLEPNASPAPAESPRSGPAVDVPGETNSATLIVGRVLADEIAVHVSFEEAYPVLGYLHRGDEVPIGARFGDWIGVPGTGWLRYSPSDIALAGAFESLPRPSPLGSVWSTAPLHPTSVRVGQAEIDSLVDTVLAGDVNSLLERIQFHSDRPEPYFLLPKDWLSSVSRSDASRWLEDMFGGRWDGELTVPAIQLQLYSVVDFSKTEYEDRGFRYLVIFGYNSGGSVAFYLSDDGDVAQIAVGQGGASPADKLYVMRADPTPTFVLRPLVPSPLVAP